MSEHHLEQHLRWITASGFAFLAKRGSQERRPVLQLPPWRNLWLLGAIALSMALHCFILYVPAAAVMFSVTPLSATEWWAVLWLSFPVILVDEFLKYLTRWVLALLPAMQVLHRSIQQDRAVQLQPLQTPQTCSQALTQARTPRHWQNSSDVIGHSLHLSSWQGRANVASGHARHEKRFPGFCRGSVGWVGCVQELHGGGAGGAAAARAVGAVGALLQGRAAAAARDGRGGAADAPLR